MSTIGSILNNNPHKMSPPAMYNSTNSSSTLPVQMNTPPRMATKRPIQPATQNDSAQSANSENQRCKKRIQFSSLGYVLPPQPPASVARRNARERNRVKQVNLGFAILRQHIPSTFCTNNSRSPNNNSKSRKVSKVETLRCAVEYIRSLQDLLDESENPSLSSENLSPSSSSTHSGTTKSFHYSHHDPAVPHTTSATSLSPSCSDASSPTPSYGSEHSYFTASSWDHYDTYDPYEAPEFSESIVPSEDELLDAISWWQQSQ